MRPWRDKPSRIIGCLINHCAMHAFLPLALPLFFTKRVVFRPHTVMHVPFPSKQNLYEEYYV